MEIICYCSYYQNLTKLGMCQQIIVKVSSVKFEAEPSSGVESFHAEERTEKEGHDEDNRSF
jgi:hypothetical protein